MKLRHADGSYTELSDEEYIARFGREEFDMVNEPTISREDMTPAQRSLQDRIDDQARTSAVLLRAGVDSLDDLPHESAQEGIPSTGRRGSGPDRT